MRNKMATWGKGKASIESIYRRGNGKKCNGLLRNFHGALNLVAGKRSLGNCGGAGRQAGRQQQQQQQQQQREQLGAAWSGVANNREPSVSFFIITILRSLASCSQLASCKPGWRMCSHFHRCYYYFCYQHQYYCCCWRVLRYEFGYSIRLKVRFVGLGSDWLLTVEGAVLWIFPGAKLFDHSL